MHVFMQGGEKLTSEQLCHQALLQDCTGQLFVSDLPSLGQRVCQAHDYIHAPLKEHPSAWKPCMRFLDTQLACIPHISGRLYKA